LSQSHWHTLATVASATCWGLLALGWLIGAVYNEQHAARARKRAARIFPWALALVVVLVLLRGIPHTGWRSLTVRSGWTYAPGLATLLVSTVFTLWARAVLGTMWTFSPVLREDHALRTAGPYAVTRHPIYTGMLGMLIGTALLAGLGRWLVVLVLAAVFIEGKIRAEERLLVEAFPGRYEQYCRRVPRLVPGSLRLREMLRRRRH
jgi:protein-S-isoprenylcysteine O-methyltransferase Ste14